MDDKLMIPSVQQTAHDLAISLLNHFLETKRIELDLKNSVPEIIDEYVYEYDRIYNDILKRLN